MKKIMILAVITLLAFLSCDSFFSDSFGNSREYDHTKIDLTINNVDDWVRATIGNPPLATAVTAAIMQKLQTVTNPAERAIYLEHASRLAMQASGLGNTIIVNAADILGGFVMDAGPQGLMDNLTDLLETLQSDFESKGGVNAANDFAALVNQGIDGQVIPRFNQEFADKVSPSDLTEAVIVLLLAEMANDGNNFSSSNLNISSLGLRTRGNPPAVHVADDGVNPPSQSSIALAAYLNLIAEDGTGKYDNNPFTSAIRNALITEPEPEPEPEEDE